MMVFGRTSMFFIFFYLFFIFIVYIIRGGEAMRYISRSTPGNKARTS